jgi:hypothetical protein
VLSQGIHGPFTPFDNIEALRWLAVGIGSDATVALPVKEIEIRFARVEQIGAQPARLLPTRNLILASSLLQLFVCDAFSAVLHPLVLLRSIGKCQTQLEQLKCRIQR